MKILSQQLLEKRLNAEDYYQSKVTPGFWTHKWRPICFTLVVDDFGVKYVGEEHTRHLLSIIKHSYKCKAEWEGGRYVGLTLDWDYEKREVHVSMPGYVHEALARFRWKAEPIEDAIEALPRKHQVIATEAWNYLFVVHLFCEHHQE